MSEAAPGLAAAAALLGRARRGVAFTGAGVSAESGIRTFRGDDGLWKEYDPYKVASIDSFLEDPARYWEVSRLRWSSFAQARPNRAHHALAAMEAAGALTAVVTQNTDGLHREAGTRRLVELHGNGRAVRCLDCGAEEARAAVQARLELELPPRCLRCRSAHIKPAVVFFGEAMPEAAVGEAFALARDCDLMLVVGSSLQVYPAADVPLTAVESGAPLVIVNAEATPLDRYATVVIRGQAGTMLPMLKDLADARNG
jgi:NAD-dependent deacetylase